MCGSVFSRCDTLSAEEYGSVPACLTVYAPVYSAALLSTLCQRSLWLREDMHVFSPAFAPRHLDRYKAHLHETRIICSED